MKLRRLSMLTCAAVVFAAPAFANDELQKLEKNPADWAMPTGDYANHRYSTLKQITAANAKICGRFGPSRPACCAAMRAAR